MKRYKMTEDINPFNGHVVQILLENEDGEWVRYEDAYYIESALRAIQLLIGDVLLKYSCAPPMASRNSDREGGE
jgi:hypothetical protein